MDRSAEPCEKTSTKREYTLRPSSTPASSAAGSESMLAPVYTNGVYTDRNEWFWPYTNRSVAPSKGPAAICATPLSGTEFSSATPTVPCVNACVRSSEGVTVTE